MFRRRDQMRCEFFEQVEKDGVLGEQIDHQQASDEVGIREL